MTTFRFSFAMKDLPYRIEWFNFPAAQPLGEALNAGAADVGGLGDAPLVFALAAGARVRAVAATRSNPLDLAIVVSAQQRTADTYEAVNVIRAHLDVRASFDRSFPLP
jgi:ABC-type phosphate/phosphonate transport system substrate-binding protein